MNSQERVVAGVALRVEARGLVLAFSGGTSHGNDGLNRTDLFGFKVSSINVIYERPLDLLVYDKKVAYKLMFVCKIWTF